MHIAQNPGIRGRSTFRATSQMSEQAPLSGGANGAANLNAVAYNPAGRAGRPRSHTSVPMTTNSIETALGDGPIKKGKTFSFGRVIPSSAVVAIIAFAFLIFAAVVARNLSSIVVPGSTTGIFQSSSDNPTGPGNNIPANINANDKAPTSPRKSSNSLDETNFSNSSTSGNAGSALGSTATTSSGTASLNSGDGSGRVSWTRSWPLTQADDDTGLYSIAAALKFTNNTMLDYFHMHKTGGVTTKTLLRELINHPDNRKQMTKRGQPLRTIETCYKAVSPLTNLSVLEVTWRCDFRQIRELPAEDLRGIDIVLGHQYWNKGCEYYFGALREIRYFSIFRHPLHRKLSFYYHFFVRNTGRLEKDVPKDEILRFILADDLPNDPRMRDAGPNYFASRMLSDGMSGFKKNVYPIEREEQDEILADILQRLEDRFVFTGLQLQTEANQCMMTKTIQVLAHVHGVDTLVGTPKLAESQKHLNSGEYPWTGQRLWQSMSNAQKAKFREVEKMDLAIYDKAVDKFKRSVKLFGCEHKVLHEHWQEDLFE